MGGRTGIEWTDATWNPTRGCRRISPGCERCYAERVAAFRLSKPGQAYHGLAVVGPEGPRWTGRGAFVADALDLPLSWREPRKIFVDSMSDLFFEAFTDEEIAAVFGVMALACHHTYQVLTKRPARMRELLTRLDLATCLEAAMKQGVNITKRQSQAVRAALPKDSPFLDANAHAALWPLPHVWLGTSVESQLYAEERVPELLRTPAAVRFLSVEPQLGPVDLSRWLQPITPMRAEDAPATWAEWTWPEWVPPEVRQQIEEFWRVDWGRGPKAWLRDCVVQGSPPFGARMEQRGRDGYADCSGRWVHAWNNIGRLIDADGKAHFSSIPSRGLFDFSPRRCWQPLHWVISGGESGPDARPMHLPWPRLLRDQCLAAGVPFFFKQWGAWVPEGHEGDALLGRKARTLPDADEGRDLFCVGKALAGRRLDGAEHSQFPEVARG